MDKSAEIYDRLEEEFDQVQNQWIKNFEVSIGNRVESKISQGLEKPLGHNFREGVFSVNPRLIVNIRNKLSRGSSEKEDYKPIVDIGKSKKQIKSQRKKEKDKSKPGGSGGIIPISPF